MILSGDFVWGFSEFKLESNAHEFAWVVLQSNSTRLMAQLEPVRMVLLILFGGSARSNYKAMRMILNEFHQQPAIVLIYCYRLAHQLGIMGGEALKLSGCMHVMHSFGKLLSATSYRKVWCSHIIYIP